MNIGIDLRPLLSPVKTGIGEFTTELLNALFLSDTTNQYYLFYNSYSDTSSLLPKYSQPNVHYVASRWPNKLFNLSTLFCRRPYLDKLICNRCSLKTNCLDYFFSPNLNFTSLSSKTKHILTVHDLTFELFPRWFTSRQRLWHTLLRPKSQCQKAAHIIVPSENTKRDIVNYFKINPEKISVLYPGVAPSFLNQTPPPLPPNLQLPKNYILSLGAIEPRKNIIALIDAFDLAYAKLPLNYSLVIAGAPGWNNKAVFKRIQKSPYRERILHVGYVAPEHKPALFRAAALFVYPSLYEGFGFPVLEAQSVGLPTITSNRSSLPEITNSGAYLVNPHNPAEIATGMQLLLGDTALRTHKIKIGLSQADKFRWSKSAAQFLELLSAIK